MFKSLFDITGVLIQLSILKSIGLVFLILFSLDFILMMVGELQNISDYQNFESFIISLAFSLPKRIYDVVPLACLIGAIVSYGRLQESGELIAIRVLGKSFKQIFSSMLLPIFILLSIMLTIGEFVIPSSNLMSEVYKTNPQQAQKAQWLTRKNELIYLGDISSDKIDNLRIYEFNSEGDIDSVFKKDEFDLSLDQKEAFFKDRASDNQIQKIWKAPSKIELSKYIKLNRQPPSLLFQNFKFSDSTREKNLFMWQFLKKIMQPISVSIFVLLALIFCQAFLRDYSITYKVLTGVVLTIFFNFTEKIAGNASIVFGFSPLITTFIFLLGLVSLIFLFSKRL